MILINIDLKFKFKQMTETINNQETIKMKAERNLQTLRLLKSQVSYTECYQQFLTSSLAYLQSLAKNLSKEHAQDKKDPNLILKKLIVKANYTKGEKKEQWVSQDAKCKIADHLKQILNSEG